MFLSEDNSVLNEANRRTAFSLPPKPSPRQHVRAQVAVKQQSSQFSQGTRHEWTPPQTAAPQRCSSLPC